MSWTFSWICCLNKENFVFHQVALAEICAKSERYIGTEGGGMDQSISFLAEAGTVCSPTAFDLCLTNMAHLKYTK